MQPCTRHRVSENGWEGEEETRVTARCGDSQVSALPTVSRVLTLSELANRDCACAWSKDKRCSLAQGPLIRQTAEVPPLPAQLPRVCKPEGGCSPALQQQQSSPCSYTAHLKHSQGCILPSQGFSEAAARCGRVGSRDTPSRWHLQESHKTPSLELQLSHQLSQSPCL